MPNTESPENFYVIRRSPSILKIEGKNALDFLDRMSTNKLRALPINHVQTTVFTNEKGRLIDVADVLHTGTGVILVGSDGAGSILQEWLERFIIMEDISISTISPETVIISVYGNDPIGIMNRMAGNGTQANDDNFIISLIDESTVIYYSPSIWQNRLISILLPELKVDVFLSSFSKLPADKIHISEVTQEKFDIFRIESGVPKLGYELLSEFNPLEAGLKKYINFTKGCYIGQEVIARIDSYNKLQKHLVSISVPTGNQSGKFLGKLIQNQKNVGLTTSSCYSTRLRSRIALGYLDSSADSGPIELELPESAIRIPVSISDLSLTR